MAIPTLKRWLNGQTFSARDYVYERDLIIAEVNRLANILGAGTPEADITVNSVSTNSITMGGQTITSFQDAGTKVYYENLPVSPIADSLFIDYD